MLYFFKIWFLTSLSIAVLLAVGGFLKSDGLQVVVGISFSFGLLLGTIAFVFIRPRTEEELKNAIGPKEQLIGKLIGVALVPFIIYKMAVHPKEDRTHKPTTPTSVRGPSSASNIVEVDQPIVESNDDIGGDIKLQATARQRELDAEETNRRSTAQIKCAQVYQRLEQFVEVGDIMGLAQFSHNNFRAVIHEEGFNEGCNELGMFMFGMGRMWETGQIPTPSEFGVRARQLARAKTLLHDPTSKLSDFNSY